MEWAMKTKAHTQDKQRSENYIEVNKLIWFDVVIIVFVLMNTFLN